MNFKSRCSALLWLGLGFSCVCACDAPPRFEGSPGFGEDPQQDAGLEEDPAFPKYAAVLGDFTATSISLLNASGENLAEGYLHSGARPANLVTALSGDVTLPTHSGERGILVVIDRFQTDAITRVRLSDGAILGQVKTHAAPKQGGQSTHSSNPQDYVWISEDSAWVSRLEPNLDPNVAEADRGTDLLKIDPSRMQRTTERIDLSGLNTIATRIHPETGLEEQVEVFARPSRMVRLGNRLVVGLARLSFDFSAVGAGAVAIVDLDSRAVTSVEFEGLENCADVNPVLDAEDRVLVSCTGFWQGARGASAGLVMLHVSDEGAQIEHIFRAKDHPSLPLAVQSPISVGGTRVLVVAVGLLDGTGRDPAEPDQFGLLDLSDMRFELLFKASSAFVLGSGVFDSRSRLVLLPDASVDRNKRPTAGIRRFRLKGDRSFEALPTTRAAGRTSMPVLSIYPL